MNVPASPRHSGLRLQRASSGRLRNSCSTSTRPKTGSARPVKTAKRPSPRARSAAVPTESCASTPNTTSAPLRGQARHARPRDDRGSMPRTFLQQQQECVPRCDAQHVDDVATASTNGACVSANTRSSARPGRGHRHRDRQRPAVQTAAPASARVERQRGVDEPRKPIAPGGHGREGSGSWGGPSRIILKQTLSR